MNLFDYVKNLFKKEYVNVNNLINISDSFVMPTRQLFKENTEVLNLIDTYKSEYKKILSDKNLLFSMDLTNNINENMRMYTELITNIFTGEEVIEDVLETKVKTFYKVNKLNLYSQEISRLNLECTARLVALLEIFNERKIFMPKHKKEAILFAMNNLTNALVVFEAQRRAIEVEKENFLDKFSTLTPAAEMAYEKKRKDFIKEKISILNKVLPFIGKEFKNDALSEMLFLERELEIYVYKNKAEVELVKNKIDEYCNFIGNESMLDKLTNFEEAFELERKALIYYYFGKNMISEDYLYKLYELKYIYLIYNTSSSTLDLTGCLNVEADGYSQACFKRIESIKKGTNPIIKKLFGNDSKSAIESIINHLHINTDLWYDGLVEPKQFLFSFDYENGFIKFLESKKVKKEGNEISFDINGYKTSYKAKFYEDIFTWEEFISLTSVYELEFLESIDGWPYYLNSSYFKLYKLYQQHLDYYKLPEGIRDIHINELGIDIVSCSKIIHGIGKMAKGKKLVFPSSLNSCMGSFSSDNEVKEIVLNDGLKVVGVNSLSCASMKSLIIPSSLEDIVFDGLFDIPYSSIGFTDGVQEEREDKIKKRLKLDNVEILIFKDYKNSQILKNWDVLRKIIEGTIIKKNGGFLESVMEIMLKDVDIDLTWNDEMLTSLRSVKLLDGDGEVVYDIDLSDIKGVEVVSDGTKSFASERVVSEIMYKLLHCNKEKNLIKKL